MKETISVKPFNRITENLDIVKVISEYLNLKKAGKNFKALCPFHEEKTPSFVVNPEKQIFHCFGCGIGGDAIKFLMSIENISFPQALALASEKAGIPLKNDGYSHRDTEEENSIYAANEFASGAYQSFLFSEQGRAALEYLIERNLKETDIKHFKLGMAPSGTAFLAGKVADAGLPAADFVKAGLLKENGKSDIFRNRIMFPIFDQRGRISGFGGRGLEERQMPKYLNTGENRIFSKGKILYGMNWARDAIKEKGFVLLVEGYFDVIKLHVNGVINAVAPMGTSLTGSQINLLKRFTDNMLLLFDSDQAGMKATLRNLEIVLGKGFGAKVCQLPPGFDPDKFVDDYGISPFIGLVNKSRDFLDFVYDIYSKQHGISTPRGKSSVAREVMRYLSLLPDDIERSEYRKALAEKLGVREEALSAYAADSPREYGEKKPVRPESRNLPRDSAESLLLGILLSDSRCWKDFLAWEGEVTPRMDVIARVSRDLLSRNMDLTPANLMAGVSEMDEAAGMKDWIAELAFKEEACPVEERKNLIFQDCLRKIHRICLCEKLENIKKEMNAKKGNGLQYNRELETLQTLLSELKKE